MTAAHSDPLWANLHRRNAKLGIFCDVDATGRQATFYSISKGRNGEWYRHDLGSSNGETPYIAVFNGSRRHTPFDAALFSLHAAYIDKLAAEIERDARDLVRAVNGRADELSEVLTHVRT